ncbi:DUF2690 domain-containing protein [Kitasatospora xanthocidica]|uniref:DUF2690 domain-containing protein n=1 Tax=Kitasatospora xanthocidica TaxID=83382 RepID=UPI00167B0F06|nr:DUF2690 domain-containing protein [Kitasatospora xanthocidica]
MTASPAVAAAGCHGNACDGRNPKSQGCQGDARDVPKSRVHAGSAPYPEVWARYSPTCQAVWAKADKADGRSFRIDVLDGPSYVESTQSSFQAFSAMVGADHTYRVCLRDVDGRWECGPWHR